MDPSAPSPLPADAAEPRPPQVPLVPGAAAEMQPIRVVLDERSSWGRFGRRLAWMLLAVSLLVNLTLLAAYRTYFQSEANQLSEKFYSHDGTARDKVAIVTIDGVIMSGEGYVGRQIDRIREDDDVKAVVVRVNSPGGTVAGSHYIYHHLRELCKQKKVPLVVSMGSVAASGGYYVAMAVGAQQEIGLNDAKDVIFAEPTTTTGSIGVILPHYNVAGLLKQWNIEDDSIKSHALKDMGTVTRQMTPEERAKFQSYINERFERFKDVVKAGRPHFRGSPGELDAIATGEIFTTTQALTYRLVDREGYLDDAIERAIEMADLDADRVRVVRYEAPRSLFNVITGTDMPSVKRSPDVATLLEMTTPEAYYLYSWLPSATMAAAKE
ncbi:MAG: signal peptide peptidase SppA [Pirellulales bacterium]